MVRLVLCSVRITKGYPYISLPTSQLLHSSRLPSWDMSQLANEPSAYKMRLETPSDLPHIVVFSQIRQHSDSGAATNKAIYRTYENFIGYRLRD